jgi:hypothetical protein
VPGTSAQDRPVWAQKFSDGEELGAPEDAQSEKMFIVTDKEICFSIDSQLQKFVIGRVFGNNANPRFDLHGLHKRQQFDLDNGLDLSGGEFEPGISQDSQVFFEYLRGNEECHLAFLPKRDQPAREPSKKQRRNEYVGVEYDSRRCLVF